MTVIMFSVVLLLFVSLCSGQKTCDIGVGQYSLCQCQMSDGTGVIDLSPYANSNGKPSLTTSSSNGFDYYLNLCFAVTEGGSCAASETSAGCQLRHSDGNEWSMGNFGTAFFIVDNSGSVSLQFSGGDENREMEIKLICDENRAADNYEFAFDHEDNLGFYHYFFTLTSRCACPHKSGVCGTPSGNGSSDSSDPGVVGIILMCLALAAFVAYFIVGAVFLRVKYQKTGTDLIIHKAFWKDFPFLVKDGVVFTFSPCVSAVRRSGKGYRYSTM